MYTFAKRAFDLVVASVLLIGLSPLMAAIALAVRLGSRGPAIFAQERAGQGGRPFTLYKFRTMRLNADPFGPSPRSGDDPRVTPFGRWLREHSLDELPQLLNIVKGDMSLVGPRPLYVSQIAEWNERQRKRLLVKPGLTGLAQVSGRGSLTRSRSSNVTSSTSNDVVCERICGSWSPRSARSWRSRYIRSTLFER